MAQSKHTKKALLASGLSVVASVAMLIGSTFAWFTDSVTSGNNKIVAGNLDVELEYKDKDTWKPVTEDTELFDQDVLWEPGHTEVVYLKVKNAGALALKYQFAVTTANETIFTNVLGKSDCHLSDYLVFGQVDSNTEISAYATREEAWAAVGDTQGLSDYTKEIELYPQGIDGKVSEQYVALVVYMPTAVGNEANYCGDTVPSIDLGVNLIATQTPFEEDGFGSDYDQNAARDELPPKTFTAASAQDFKNALSSGDSVAITVTEPIKESLGTLDINGNVSIDITQMQENDAGVAGEALNVSNGGKLTVTGNWQYGGRFSSFRVKRMVVSGNGSRMTFNNIHSAANSDAGQTAMTAKDGGTIVITDGYYSTSGSPSTVVCAEDGGTVIITGGYFRANGNQGPTLKAVGTGKIIIAKDVYDEQVDQTTHQKIPETCRAVLDGDNYIITEIA